MSLEARLRVVGSLLALSTIACGSEPPASDVRESRSAAPTEASSGRPSGPETCAHGIWNGDGILAFEYLACSTDADCVVVTWGAECETTTTYSAAHAACVTLSPICPSGDGPTDAWCNDDGTCELVL